MTPDQQLPQQGNIPETPRAASFPAQDQANAAKLYLQPEVGEIYSEDDLIATYERDTPGLTHADYEETLRDAVLKGCLVALDFCVDVRVEGEPHARVPADVVYEQGRLDDDVVNALCTLSQDRTAIVHVGGGASAVFTYSVAPTPGAPDGTVSR